MGNNQLIPKLNRFWAGDARPGHTLQLDPSEAHHLLHVLRLGEGDLISLINGKGQEFEGHIARIKGKKVWIKVLKLRRTEPPPKKEIIFILPLLKKDYTLFLAEKAVELGITKLQPFYNQHTVLRPTDHLRTKLEARSRQALKQCGRLWALTIEPLRPLWELEIPAERKIFAYEKETSLSLKTVLNGFKGQSLALLSGPEGGFTPEEAQRLREKGFIAVSLGPYVLRAETAAFYLMSLAHAWAYLDPNGLFSFRSL